ncbi:alpha-L-iduronidase [Trichonephila clavata]|uniref:Alpha-L-iduronidase n=1 Tax=Trichonephila clavata TaxID=2740835 RepID=A0A8X6GYU9_TRICU|nr:alpha-L-iduronidase [Trichonephila clavata]
MLIFVLLFLRDVICLHDNFSLTFVNEDCEKMWNSYAALLTNGDIPDDETMIALIDAEMEREMSGSSQRVSPHHDLLLEGWMPGDLSWPTFLDRFELVGVNDLPPEEDDETIIARLNEREVECKFCNTFIKVKDITMHMDQKHYSKVLRPVNDNKIVGQEGEVENEVEHPSHGIYDRSSDLHDKIMPGTSMRKNKGNYYMKIYREKTDANYQAVKQKLVAKIKQRIIPPDPHQDAPKFLLSEDLKLNLFHIGSQAHNGISQVRIHWMLDLVQMRFLPNFEIVYDFNYLDQLVYMLWENGLRPGFELMGNPSGYFTDFENETQVYMWKDLIYRLASHYIDVFGIDYVSKWNFETWNEPDHHDFDDLNITIQGKFS